MGTEKRERQKQNRRIRLEEQADDWRRRQRNRKLGSLAIIAFLVAVALGVTTLLGDDDTDEAATDDPSATTVPTTVAGATTTAVPVELYGSGTCPPAEGVESPVIDFDAPPQQCIDPTRSYTAVIETSEGQVTVALDTEQTPATTNNFVTLSRYGYYDGTKIFRTDPSIEIIQGGAPHTNDPSDPGPGYTIADEGAGYTYEPGQLVMARTAGPNSASAQFFFVVGPAASALDAQGTYVVFGDVTEGMDVLETIIGLHEDDPTNPLGGAPSREVTIDKVTITET